MNAKKPLIGITCNYDYQNTVGAASGMGIAGQDWNYVAGDYVYALEKAGAIPVLLPRCNDFEDVKPLLEKLDGVLISGGHDVGPERYNMPTKGYCGTIIPMRDEHDLGVAKYALEHKMPILGICRGIQILNVACGGTLYQDLEKEGNFEHHMGDRYPRNYPWHKVTPEAGSKLEQIFGAKEVAVNSFHHQAVCKPGEGVKVAARSCVDGVTESIEVEDHPFAVGVQWHPEMMYDSDEQPKLIRAFVEACR